MKPDHVEHSWEIITFSNYDLLISEDEGNLHVGGDHVGDWVRRRVRDLVVREECALRRLQQCRSRHFDSADSDLWFIICLRIASFVMKECGVDVGGQSGATGTTGTTATTFTPTSMSTQCWHLLGLAYLTKWILFCSVYAMPKCIAWYVS